MYTYYIDNQQTLNYQSLIFGFKRINLNIKLEDFCLNNSTKTLSTINERSNFTSDCYYPDSNNNWQ